MDPLHIYQGHEDRQERRAAGFPTTGVHVDVLPHRGGVADEARKLHLSAAVLRAAVTVRKRRRERRSALAPCREYVTLGYIGMVLEGL